MSAVNSMMSCLLSEKIGVGDWLSPQYFEKPIRLDGLMSQLDEEGKLIEIFLNTASEIARDSIKNNNIELIKILFSEAPVGMDVSYHKNLPDSCWKSPILYRTDQSISGKIYEIQSPGSGWGDLYLYAECMGKNGCNIPERYFRFPQEYIENIKSATKKDRPKVYYMMDASSVPHSIKYMQAITHHSIDYWGLSREVKMNEVDCVIAHSVASLVAANYFRTYLNKAIEGKLVFGLPPNVIYDEKAIYLLPFYRSTRRYFSDDIRDIFPFTSFLEDGGFFDENGEFVTIEAFSKKAKKDRMYYLKYGGPDTDRNWGSRSVHRLSGSDCMRRLEDANELAKKGEIWLIQKDVSKEKPAIFPIDLKECTDQKFTVKLSGFFGTGKLFGVKVMARHHFKVHGQEDTYVGLGI